MTLPEVPNEAPLEHRERPKSVGQSMENTVDWGPFQNLCLDSRKATVAKDGIIPMELEISVHGLALP